MQGVSFEPEPFFYAFELGPNSIDLVILEDDIRMMLSTSEDVLSGSQILHPRSLFSTDPRSPHRGPVTVPLGTLRTLRSADARLDSNRDHALVFVRCINVHHQIPAIGNGLVHRLNPIFVAVVGNVPEKQCPIARGGFADYHPARMEALDRVEGKVPDKAADIYDHGVRRAESDRGRNYCL